MNDINIDRHIWEGWRVRDFIEELQPQLDCIMEDRSWRSPFESVDGMYEWIRDNQPYYKKDIPEVKEYFRRRYYGRQ